MTKPSGFHKLRITCLVSNDLVHDQRMHRVCSALHEAGHVVRLLGRRRQGSPALREVPYQHLRLNTGTESGFAFYALLNIRFFLCLLFHRADVIYAVDMDTLPAAVLAGKIKDSSIVYDAHEYFSESPELVQRPRTKAFWQRLEQWLIPRADTCITVSYSLAAHLEQRFQRLFIVVRNLPQYYPFPEIVKEKPFLLYQGALNAGRGLEAMILAMKELPMQLKIAGEGDLSAQLRALVMQEGLQDRLEFLGWLSPDALKALTPGAWLGINLLEPLGKSYQMSLANKFFDYVMAGVPVLCTPFEEYKQADETFHVAQWVDTLSPEAIRQAVMALLDDRDKYEILRSNCLTAREAWHWDMEKQVLLTAIERLG
jgi:glycosyltransferase involved in cell wall biosynthesis